MSFADRLAVWPQYLLPKMLLTRLAGALAQAEAGALTSWVIRRFALRYRINMLEAESAVPEHYPSFNAFFTRALKAGTRPLADAPWLCPVDGAVSQCGRIKQGELIQAKGHHYSAQALLGGDARRAAAYADGHFATLYLSPSDYHRIHMPCAAELRRMVHVPGALFSVNPTTALGVPGLFARNERVVCHFVGPRGPFVMVLVGATIVGSMATVWHGQVNPPRPGKIRIWRYAPGEVRLARGAEMGRFLLGSTVVMLMPPGPLVFHPRWHPGTTVRMGEAMAS